MIKLSSENENVQNFLDFVHSQLKKNKFKLVLSLDDLKIGKNSVGGYFDEENKEIVISINDSEWLSILVHEFNHFLQFINNTEKYRLLNDGDTDMLSEVWEWLDKEIEFPNIKRRNLVFKRVLEMELECEMNSVNMIKKFDLPINLDEYIYCAYVYLNYYNFCKKYRTWFLEDVKLADIVEIKDASIEFGGISLDRKFNTLPKQFDEIFKKYSKIP